MSNQAADLEEVKDPPNTPAFSEPKPNAPNLKVISKESHDELQKSLHLKLNTFLTTRGLYKAVVRKIPIFLNKDEFILGLNVSLPVV